MNRPSIKFEISKPLRARMILPVSLVFLITVAGTLGYFWLGREQGATLLDALYMTIITITTIGYAEVIRLDSLGRVFTMIIALTGIGSLYYSLTMIMEYLVSARLSDPYGEKKMLREISKLNQHIIIAGLGRVGRQAASELHEAKVSFVILDSSMEAMQYAQQHDYLIVHGDAADDLTLEKAGIHRAKGLIVTTSDDASNLYIILSARVLKHDLFIVSRAVDDASIPKLIRAGANRAISPYAIGGRRLAHLILSPTVVDFFDTVIKRGEESLNLEGIKVEPGASAIGASLVQLDAYHNTGASILVILRGNQVLPNPTEETVLQKGDELLVLGTMAQLEGLERLIIGR
jgi:voltage-gated potassium channel